MSGSKKLTTQARRYDRRYDRMRKAQQKSAAADEFFRHYLWYLVSSIAGVGGGVGALFGTGWEHLGNAAIGALMGFFLAVLVVPLSALCTLAVFTVPELLLGKTARPSKAERLLYELEQHRDNPVLDWLHADIDVALPAARRAAKTGVALRTADTDVVSIAASEDALRPCLDSLQRLTYRCGVEANKAEKVLVGVSKKEAPCYLYTSDAEDLARAVTVAEAVATFREETLARQKQVSM